MKAAPQTKIINTSGDVVTTEAMSLAYVAMSRAKNKLVVYEGDMGFEMLGDSNIPTTPTTSPSTNNLSPDDFTDHSGGASGGDTYWDIEGRKFGIKNFIHYREPGKTVVDSKELRESGIRATSASEKDYAEGIKMATQAAKNLGRKISTNYGYYQYRNWLQVKYSDAIFAVSTILEPNQTDKKGYKNTSGKQVVEGGTGYAVEMAIMVNKPVYVFDQNKNKWYTWQYSSTNLLGEGVGGKFVETTTPVLTKNFAGIGSREIKPNGIQAITDVYTKTFGSGLSLNDFDFTDGVPTGKSMLAGINSLGSTVGEFMRTLNREDRIVLRQMIDNKEVIFKCK